MPVLFPCPACVWRFAAFVNHGATPCSSYRIFAFFHFLPPPTKCLGGLLLIFCDEFDFVCVSFFCSGLHTPALNGVTDPSPEGRNWLQHDFWPLYDLRYSLREYFAEFFGTLLLILFGTGVVATSTFNGGSNTDANAGYLLITFGWGMGLCIALYVSMGVSGGHLNPAVTLANAFFGVFPWRKVPGFIMAQLLGAMTGAACMYGIFSHGFHETEKHLKPGETMTGRVGGIFCTYPIIPSGNAVWSEILNSMVLMLAILCIVDEKMTPAVNFKPVAVGLLVFVLGTCTGLGSGYAMNPARDLGPRLVSAMIFKSSEPFTQNSHYFWIPTFMPVVGTTLGMFIYAVFIIATRG